MTTLTQTAPSDPSNENPDSENSSCAPTNQESAPADRPSKKKFVMFPRDSDDSDTELEDDLLSQFEITNPKSIVDEEIKFVPASESSKLNPNQSAMRELERKGLLIRVGYEESSNVKPSNTESTSQPKSIKPLFSPETLKMEWTQPRKIGSGLYNLGNTCFLNSVLQCLTYTPALANYFGSRQHTNNCSFKAICAMCSLEKHYFQCQSSFYPVRPGIGSYLHKISPSFLPGRQEDAHEFLRYLVDAMQSSCLLNSPNKISQELKCTTLIHQIFGGQVMSQVTCLVCQTKSDTFEPMLDLSLHIKSCGSIQEAMRRATLPDRLEGNNSYFCEKCKKKCPAQKFVNISRPPRVLTIHLKRFSFGSQLGFKLQTKIRFTPQLDITPYLRNKQESNVLYKLYAVLVHSGFTCNSGHYYCYVVGPNGNWHKMNDTYVSPVGEHIVLDSEAYMLFYRQIAKPPQRKPQSKLVVEGLSSAQPSPLSTKQQNTNNKSSTPNIKKTLFEMLSKPNLPDSSKRKIENKFETPKKINSKNSIEMENTSEKPKTPSNDTSNNPLNSVEIGSKIINKDPNSSNDSMDSNTDQTNVNQDSSNSEKENSNSINDFKATTSKPVAVVTPKQPDTVKTPSRISSSAVHKENAFKTPTQPVNPMKFYKNTSLPIKKKTNQPSLDTAAVEDRVKQAQKNVRNFSVPSTLQDEFDALEVPSKKPKLDSSPLVNKVTPLVSELKIEKIVENKNGENVNNNKNKSKSDSQEEKPQVTKGFSITGVQGVKPTAVVPPANVETMNTEPIDRDVVESNLAEVSQSDEERREVRKSKKVKNPDRKNRRERHKERYLKRISSTDSGKDKEMLVNRALKKYFESMEDLEKALIEFSKRKLKVEKKTKGSREKHKKKSKEIDSGTDTSETSKRTHKSNSNENSITSPHKHAHKSNNQTETSYNTHKDGKSLSRTKSSDLSRDGTEMIKVLKEKSFQSLGGNCKLIIETKTVPKY